MTANHRARQLSTSRTAIMKKHEGQECGEMLDSADEFEVVIHYNRERSACA